MAFSCFSQENAYLKFLGERSDGSSDDKTEECYNNLSYWTISQIESS